MSPPRILVTRSEPGASETAARLSQRGFAPLVEPVFEIEPVPAILPEFDALAFTSANGVRAFSRLSSRRDVPVFCVGERTGDEARACGFSDVSCAEGDVVSLAALIPTRLSPAKRLLHSGNLDRRGDLVGALKAAGYAAEFVATYRAIPSEAAGPNLARHLVGQRMFEACLVHSPKGGHILAGFLAAAPGRAPVAVAAISPAAAEPLTHLASAMEIAAAPAEEPLLKALERLGLSG